MEADREPVRLVANPLQELEPGRVRVEPDRVGPARQKNLLCPLRECDHSHPREVEALHRRQRS